MRGKQPRVRLIYVSLVMILSLPESSLFTKELTIAFPKGLPPWTFTETDRGIAVDLVREALKYRGHTLKTNYISLARLNHKVILDKVDAHAMVESTVLEGFYSKALMEFHTSVISLKMNPFHLKDISDLSHYSILAFRNAHLLFEDEFHQKQPSLPGDKGSGKAGGVTL